METANLYALILAVLSAVTAGLVGSFALMKRVVLAGDVISHIALPGIGLALLYNANPLLGGGVALLLGVILIWHLEKRTGLTTDAMIGVIFVAAVAVGALLTPDEHLVEALFGGFEALDAKSFISGLGLATLAIGLLIKYRNELILNLFSPDLARTTRINVNAMNLLFLLIFGMTVILGLQFLGSLLTGALIIVPAATGRQLAYTYGGFLSASVLFSVASMLTGMFLAGRFGWDLGPAVVAVASVIFFVSMFFRRK